MEYSINSMMEQFLEYENRGMFSKEIYLKMDADIDGLKSYFDDLKILRSNLKNARKGKDKYLVEDLKSEIKDLKDEFQKCIGKLLESALYDLQQGTYHLDLEIVSMEDEDKPIFQVKKNVINTIFMGLLNKDLRSCYKVVPANRIQILQSIKEVLSEKHPMFLLRLDVKSFFESISFEELLDKIEDDSLLRQESLVLLSMIRTQYKAIGKNVYGIPRGVNCSPYLSEIFMRDIDTRIKNIPGVYFYQRYVDDMVVFIYPKLGESIYYYYHQIKNVIEKNGLRLHSPKEKGKARLVDSSKYKTFSIRYLGYRIKKCEYGIEFSLSDDKYGKMESTLHKAFDDFKTDLHFRNKGALSRLLIKLRMLTSNYKLVGSKNYVMSGIFYKYPLLTNTWQLEKLDSILTAEIASITPQLIPEKMGKFDNIKFSRKQTAEYIRKRCSKYSFLKGYQEVKKTIFSPQAYRKFVKKNLYEKVQDK